MRFPTFHSVILRESKTLLKARVSAHSAWCLHRSMVSDVKCLMEDGDPEGYPSMLNCPYLEGAKLPMSIKLEDASRRDVDYSLTVQVERPLLPFTSAQALLVRVISASPPGIPNRLVIKLQDRRFRRTLAWDAAYDPTLDTSIRNGLYGMLRLGIKPNPFSLLGGTDEAPDPGTMPWMDHVKDWVIGQHTFTSEVNAYRRLRDFQGRLIPRMFGTVRSEIRQPDDIDDPPGFVHPILDSVDGLALEYIEGSSLNAFKVGVNISEADADRVAHATFAALREIRELRVCHNDLRLANVVVRDGDFDNPVIIDWARAIIKRPKQSDEDWAHSLPYSPIDRMRRMFADDDFHMPSPYASQCKEHPQYGYSIFNGRVEQLRPDWRERLFEPIEGHASQSPDQADKGQKYGWEPAEWRPRHGIRYAPDRDLHRL